MELLGREIDEETPWAFNRNGMEARL